MTEKEYDFEECLNDMVKIVTLADEIDSSPNARNDPNSEEKAEQMKMLIRVRDYLIKNIAVGGG